MYEAKSARSVSVVPVDVWRSSFFIENPVIFVLHHADMMMFFFLMQRSDDLF